MKAADLVTDGPLVLTVAYDKNALEELDPDEIDPVSQVLIILLLSKTVRWFLWPIFG